MGFCLNSEIPNFLLEDFYLYEIGWLSPNDYTEDPDHLSLNASRKSNICIGSEIQIGDFENYIEPDMTNYFLND